MIWRAGLDKGCDYFNPQWYAFTGRSPEQEYGDGWAQGVHRDDLVHCLAIYVESFDARRSFEMYYRIRNREGIYRWIFDRGAPMQDGHGTFSGFFGTCVDVTDQVQPDSELERRCMRTSLEEGQLIHSCAWCGRVLGEDGQWHEMKRFLQGRRRDITHTICSSCQSVVLEGAVANFPPRSVSEKESTGGN